MRPEPGFWPQHGHAQQLSRVEPFANLRMRKAHGPPEAAVRGFRNPACQLGLHGERSVIPGLESFDLWPYCSKPPDAARGEVFQRSRLPMASITSDLPTRTTIPLPWKDAVPARQTSPGNPIPFPRPSRPLRNAALPVRLSRSLPDMTNPQSARWACSGTLAATRRRSAQPGSGSAEPRLGRGALLPPPDPSSGPPAADNGPLRMAKGRYRFMLPS